MILRMKMYYAYTSIFKINFEHSFSKLFFQMFYLFIYFFYENMKTKIPTEKLVWEPNIMMNILNVKIYSKILNIK